MFGSSQQQNVLLGGRLREKPKYFHCLCLVVLFVTKALRSFWKFLITKSDQVTRSSEARGQKSVRSLSNG